MTVFFLGWTAQYELRMIHYLTQHRDAQLLRIPKLYKRLLRWKVSSRLLASIILKKHRITASDILVCNEGQVHRGLIPAVVKDFPGTTVLLVRDLVDAAFVAKMRPVFDHLYSYDEVQCSTLGMTHLKQFFPYSAQEAQALANTHCPLAVPQTCYFLGRDKGRSADIERIAIELEAAGCRADFSVVRDGTSASANRFHIDDVLTYEQSVEKTLQSDVLLEINQPGQSGMTLRPLEALFFGKKLITNNPLVQQADFYSPGNVLVIDEKSPTGIKAFLDLPMTPVAPEVAYRYSPDAMLDRIVEDATAQHAQVG